MRLTLGQAAKEVGLSKTALSNAIRNGRMSADKKETGEYSIDPAELFRVYPPKGKDDSKELTKLDSVNGQVNGGQQPVLTEKISGLETLLEEKDKQIERLIREKEKTEELLSEQTQQAKRITLLLEDHRTKEGRGETWEKAIRSLEQRIANQEKSAKEREAKEQRLLKQNRGLKQALEAEKNKSFWQKLFG